MTISDRSRKILWAKSGNQCALCKKKLIIETSGKSTIVGEECHIVSAKEKGPRFRTMKYYDEYENLILLCSVHHKLIDDNEDTFTEEILKQIKKNHEMTVLKNNETKEKRVVLNIAENVRDVVRIVHDAQQYSTEYPVDKKEDYELFSCFIELINNSDIIDDMDEFSRINYYEEYFNELKNKGYYILIGRASLGKYNLDTAIVHIVTEEELDKYKI